MSIEFEPIPEFLLVKGKETERAEARKNLKLTRVRDDRKLDYSVPRTLDIVGKAMLKAQRKEKARRLIELRKKRRNRA
jgi:hypothetical protein